MQHLPGRKEERGSRKREEGRKKEEENSKQWRAAKPISVMIPAQPGKSHLLTPSLPMATSFNQEKHPHPQTWYRQYHPRVSILKLTLAFMMTIPPWQRKKKKFHFSFHPSPVSKKQVEKTEIATSSCHSVSVFLLGIEQSNLKRTV